MHQIVNAGLSDGWLMAMMGALAAFAGGGYAYTWIVQGWLSRAKENLSERIDAVSGDTAKNFGKLIGDVQNMSVGLRGEFRGEMGQHALEDARTFATKDELGARMDEIRETMRDMNGKLDRLVMRPHHD